MINSSDKFTIPNNSLSVYIGRICEDVGDKFAEDGNLWVDIYDVAGTEGKPDHGEEGTTQLKAKASWTLRAAYIAWKNPPKITFKGSAKLKGKISMPNAQLSNVTLAGGPPLMGTTVTIPALPGVSTTPFTISAATGMAKIEQAIGAEIDMATEGDNLDIELTSQKAAQLPWCVKSDGASEGDEVDEEELFIKAGDLALCIATGNDVQNLYVVDILR
jgi:hypothetical protein